MARLSLRLFASAERALFQSDKGERFLKEIKQRLVAAKSGQLQANSTRISYWEDIEHDAAHFRVSAKESDQLSQLLNETSDPELKALAQEDFQTVEAKTDEIAERLAQVALPKSEADVLKKCQIEFAAGAGGQEAMLFTGELLEMYRRYSEWRGWKWTPFQIEDVPLGGIRSAAVAVEGDGCFAALRFEAGIHRVQRIPLTDKSRMHTSTSSVTVLPEPDEISLILPPDSHLNLQIAYKRLAACLLQQRFDSADEKTMSARKLQMGSRARAEKIRTYNFKDDRITDHRIHVNFSNIEELMCGTEHLDDLIRRLSDFDRQERLKQIIDDCIVE
ncbi:unnamed protein product, partial [Mesorhabditis belari]|uniref:Peptide chain release factor domain-containing protein n=1 Tax=Mesorhabditis belari TaxID=2138241 RepID=A0AAF3EQ11_9BILA